MKKILLLLGIVLLMGCSNTSIAVFDEPVNTTVTNTAVQLVPMADFDTICSFDLNPNVACLVFTGHNPDIDNSGGREDLWEGGGLLQYQSVAELQNITSTDSDDTVNGTGAQLLILQCLNASFLVETEFINLDGTNTVQSTLECIRIRFAAVSLSGSSEFNEGIITITSADSNLLQAQMDSGEAFTKNSQFTVQANHTGIIKNIMFSATRTGGGQEPVVNFKGKIRFFESNTWVETFNFKIDTSINDHLIMDNPISNQITARTDIRIEATSTNDNTDGNARIFIIEVRNDPITGIPMILG